MLATKPPRLSFTPGRSWLMALPAVVFLLTIALTVGAAVITRESLDNASSARLEIIAGPLAERIGDRLQGAAAVARGTAALFSTETSVKPSAFQAYIAAQAMPRWFGTATVGWAPTTAGQTTELLLMQGRREYAGYRFERDLPRFPVLFLAPRSEERNEQLGVDLADFPVRLKAIERARDEGKVTMAHVVELGSERPSIEVYYPAYDRVRPDTLEDRRAAFRGVVFVTSATDDLLASSLGAVAPYFEFRVRDTEFGTEPVGASKGFAERASEPMVTRVLSFGGHTMQVELTPTERQQDPSERQAIVAILGVGSLLALALAVLIFQQQRARRAAEIAAEATAAALEDAERRRALLDLVVAQTSDGIVMADSTATVRIFNAAAGAQHGVSQTDISAQHWQRTFNLFTVDGAPLKLEDTPLYRAVQGELVLEARWMVRKPDGEETVLSGSASPLRDAEGKGAGGVLVTRDETARLRSEADRERLIAALEFSNAELDQFASVASHDLKAPLRGIAQLAQFLEEDLGSAVNAEARKHFALLQGRVRRLQALIDGILNYARAGQSTQTLETFDARGASAEAVALVGVPSSVQVLLPASGIIINGDRTVLQQALMNLLSNALKHGPAGGKITVDAQTDGPWVRFSVKDEGPGIAPEYHQRVWGMFQTLSARDEKESTGIGLAVVRKVVQAQGGRAWLESSPGHGAAFYFTWPRRLKK